MKQWFKYEYGFVNVDENNLYLTNTGNWSEVKTLEEKSNNRSLNVPKWKAILFMLVVGVIFLYMFLTNLMSGKISLLLIIGLPVGGYAVHKYIKSEIGNSYKIPRSKILSASIENKVVQLTFLDADDKEQTETLINVSESGIKLLEELHESVSSDNIN